MEIVKESVFISAIRSLCKTLFGTVGIFLAFIPLFIIGSLSLGSKEASDKTIFTLLPDLSGSNSLKPLSSPVILQLSIQGVIGEDSLTAQVISSQLLDSHKGALQKDRVKGILLYLKTPGGTVIDSDNIYRMLMQYKKRFSVPIYAYVDGLCASGGVYISCAADKIFSSPISEIGSVGVRAGEYFNVYDLLTKHDIKLVSVNNGTNRNALSPFTSWENVGKESENLQNICAGLYQNFVDIVSSARPLLTKEKLINEYGANFYLAPQAQEYGYIDNGNACYDDALSELLATAKIDTSKPYQVVELQARAKWLASLFKGDSAIINLLGYFFNTPKKNNGMQHFSYLSQP